MSHPARVYVDESYGDDGSFVVQTAVALPAGNAEIAFNEILEAKIAENPRFDREEFKAKGLSGKNQYVFQWFLQQAINILGEVADRTPCRTLVTIDSVEKYRSDVYDRLYEQLKGSLTDIGYTDAEIGHARDFIRQVIWLHARLPRLIPPAGAGGVELFFDEKYRMDLSFKEDIAAWVPRGEARVRFEEERWKTYTRLLRILLQVLPTTQTFPEVASFTYVNSKSSYLIQAADLLSNLTLNAIRHRMGVTDDMTRMKYDMLCSVMSDDPIAGDLLAAFAVRDGKVSCQDVELFSSIELGA
jgi:Protein of unknown function (DUF3800)